MASSESLFHNGTVCTMDPSMPYAEAVAVRDGIILRTGTAADCRAMLGPSCNPIDMKGGFLLPGFCDAHIHPLSTIFYNMTVNLGGVRNFGEMRARLADQTGCYTAGSWIVGVNFDEQGMDEPLLPTRYDLDMVSTELPVVVTKHDGHTFYLNSKALATAGINASTPEPRGGVIGREASGEPNGVLHESAVPLILNHFPLPTMDDFNEGARRSFESMLSLGITSLGLIMQTGEEGPEGTLGILDVPVMESIMDRIPQSLYAFVVTRDITSVLALREKGLCNNPGGRSLRVAGIKIIADGTFGSCTAAMREPFSDFPDKSGFMLHDIESMYRLMREAHGAGLQIAIHAIGDLANRHCIDLYGRLLADIPRRDHRHRIEHASVLDQAMIRDAAALGLVFAVQPMFIHTEHRWLATRFGEKRIASIYPFKSIIDAGITLAGSSDSPVETQSVLQAVESCVTRCGFVPGQSIGVEDALRMYTAGAAFAQFEENVRGSITTGKRADLVLLEQNPLIVPRGEIHSIRVLNTIIGGAVLYDAS